MIDLGGKVAVITGGASGIGLETGRQLALRGARLVMVDIEADSLATAVDGLRSGGAEAVVMTCDVSSHEAVNELADRAFAEMGGSTSCSTTPGSQSGGRSPR